MVSRGQYMYAFFFVGRPEGPDALGAAVADVLETVRFMD